MKRNTFKNNIFLYSKSELLPKNIYLSIIATTANSRVKVTKSILGKRKIKYLSNNTPDYDTNGNIQYDDDLDSDGNQQSIYNYQTRFLKRCIQL